MSSSLNEAIADFRRGRFLVLVDAPDRENEGDLILAAQFATAESVNFMVREAGGMFLFAATEEHLAKIGISPIEPRHGNVTTPRLGHPFDARVGVSSGISAADRAATVQQAIHVGADSSDFVVPGHVLPLAAHPELLAGRQGHTEGAVEMARLAGLFPAAVMSEVLTAEGSMARGDALAQFARRVACRIIDIETIQTAVTNYPLNQRG